MIIVPTNKLQPNGQNDHVLNYQPQTVNSLTNDPTDQQTKNASKQPTRLTLYSANNRLNPFVQSSR